MIRNCILYMIRSPLDEGQIKSLEYFESIDRYSIRAMENKKSEKNVDPLKKIFKNFEQSNK